MLHLCNYGGGAVSHDPNGMKLFEYEAARRFTLTLALTLTLIRGSIRRLGHPGEPYHPLGRSPDHTAKIWLLSRHVEE